MTCAAVFVRKRSHRRCAEYLERHFQIWSSSHTLYSPHLWSSCCETAPHGGAFSRHACCVFLLFVLFCFKALINHCVRKLPPWLLSLSYTIVLM